MKVGDTVWVLTEYSYTPFPRRIVHLDPLYGHLDDGWAFHRREMRLAGGDGGVYTDPELAVQWLRFKRSLPWRVPPGVTLVDIAAATACVAARTDPTPEA